jgi:nicotinamide mononucleotide adenylyltransferase
MQKKKIVLLSAGSFNPLTNGHLLMLEHTKNEIQFRFDVVQGYISPVNQEYGKKGLIESNHRAKMCSFGLGFWNWIKLDSWEAKQLPGEMKKLREEYNCDPSFKGVPTAAVIQHIRESTGMPVGFVCGADLFTGFEREDFWTDSEIELIIGDYLFVVERGECTAEIMKKTLDNRTILQTLKDKITFIKPATRNDVSSSAVRKLLKEGKSIKYLVPDPVAKYIMYEGLFE